MFASVIFTTYNHPKWLEKTLWGFSAQTYRDFEIIVADDGSEQETRDVVEAMKSKIEIPIQHLWQRDNGFQKCKILNKAIVASQGEYLIFTDGDCIPHPDFVKNHVELSAENTMLSGGYFKLPLELSPEDKRAASLAAKRAFIEANESSSFRTRSSRPSQEDFDFELFKASSTRAEEPSSLRRMSFMRLTSPRRYFIWP